MCFWVCHEVLKALKCKFRDVVFNDPLSAGCCSLNFLRFAQPPLLLLLPFLHFSLILLSRTVIFLLFLLSVASSPLSSFAFSPFRSPSHSSSPSFVATVILALCLLHHQPPPLPHASASPLYNRPCSSIWLSESCDGEWASSARAAHTHTPYTVISVSPQIPSIPQRHDSPTFVLARWGIGTSAEFCNIGFFFRQKCREPGEDKVFYDCRK